MTLADALSIALFLVGLPGVFYGFRTVRSTTALDKQRAADALAAQLATVRDEERDRYDTERRRDAERIHELINDRDYQRNRADGLQAAINALNSHRSEG